MKRYIDGLYYRGNKIRLINGMKNVIGIDVDVYYDEETDKFIEVNKSLGYIMDILFSDAGSEYEKECFNKLKSLGISYKDTFNDGDVYIDEESISLNSNENDYLKRMVKEGVLNVPKCMFPDKSEWEKVGFIFSQDNDKSDYCYMDIPSNWSLEINERCGVFNIIDDKGRARGYINPSINNYYKVPFMRLFSRYNIHRYIEDGKKYYYFGEKDRPLFMSNEINKENENLNYIIIMEKANIMYPGWKKPSKYWNDRAVKKLTRKS